MESKKPWQSAINLLNFSGDKQNVYPFDEVIYNLMYYLEEEYSESQLEQADDEQSAILM